ncbi:WD repeat domain 61 [Phyllostomus discolor]|uniref:Superkiller complex protein 8 n=1 Tax=Phyllostomus discolor TaxID=89673 RepID=A0A833YNG4_9CHIR|nr:WD repeat domain 61 [Phyllostomus discolor]
MRCDERLDLQWSLEGHQLGVVSVDISHTLPIAASSSLDAHIRLWDLENGKQIKSIDAGPVDAWTLAFSPDSQYLATGTHVGKVNIFGVESGKKEYSLDTRGKFILSIAYFIGQKREGLGCGDENVCSHLLRPPGSGLGSEIQWKWLKNCVCRRRSGNPRLRLPGLDVRVLRADAAERTYRQVSSSPAGTAALTMHRLPPAPATDSCAAPWPQHLGLRLAAGEREVCTADTGACPPP